MKRHFFNYTIFLNFLLLLLLYTANTNYGFAQSSVQAKKAGYYQNPVFPHDFADPNFVKGKDGYFYAYSTITNWKWDTLKDVDHLIPILRSKDLMSWTYIGDALKKFPSWKQQGGLWAPDVTYYNGQYYLFYSFATARDPDPGIGLAVSKNPAGPFIDKGKIFFSKEIGVNGSVDPFLLVDKENLYLIWGSFEGIYGIQLAADGTKYIGKKTAIAGTAYEASYVYKRGKYFYYFGSQGSCCSGVNSTYNVKVGRSLSSLGPYIDRDGKSLLENGGTLLIQGNKGAEGFVGPGHNGDIFTDSNGDTWILYHALDKIHDYKRMLMLDKIIWKNDWPYIVNSQPTYTLQKGPVFK